MSLYSLFRPKAEPHAMPANQTPAPPPAPSGGGFPGFASQVGAALRNIRGNVGAPAGSAAELQARDRAAADERAKNAYHPLADRHPGVATPIMRDATGGPGALVGPGSVTRAAPTVPRGVPDVAGVMERMKAMPR